MQNLTKLLHFLLIICFFLPFIPKGCEGPFCRSSCSEVADSAAPVIEEPAPAYIDTSESVTDFQDRAEIDSCTGISQADTCRDSINGSDTIKKERNKIVDFIISPDKENYSGIGFLITYYTYVLFNTGLFVALICSIFGFLISFSYHKHKKLLYRISVFNLLSWLLMLISINVFTKIGVLLGTLIALVNFVIQRKTRSA